MNETPKTDVDPKAFAGLTLMRRLVTALLVVMIAGFLVLIGLLVTRLSSLDGATDAEIAFELPEVIQLPEGARASAFTRGDDWVAIVSQGTAGDEVLIFDAETGALRQRIEIK